jgi:hypothetical protein
MRTRLLYVTAIAAALIGLGGCTAAFLNTAAHGIFTQEEINFREKNFATADYLVGQARAFIKHNDLVVAEPLSDVHQPGMESDMSKMIPEQIGVRMSQLGYRMDLERVATTKDTNYLKPAKSDNAKPKFILTGTFLRQRRDMDVSVRIVDATSARVVAAFDYTLPMTREVNDLAAPQPKIIRMRPPQ